MLDVRIEILTAVDSRFHFFDPAVYHPLADGRPSAAAVEARKRRRYPVRWPDGSKRVDGELHPLAISTLGGLSANGVQSLRRVGKLIRKPVPQLVQSLGFWAVLATARSVLSSYGVASATRANLV